MFISCWLTGGISTFVLCFPSAAFKFFWLTTTLFSSPVFLPIYNNLIHAPAVLLSTRWSVSAVGKQVFPVSPALTFQALVVYQWVSGLWVRLGSLFILRGHTIHIMKGKDRQKMREWGWLEKPFPQTESLFRFLTLDFFRSWTIRAHLALHFTFVTLVLHSWKTSPGRKIVERQPVLLFTHSLTAVLKRVVFGMCIHPGVQLEAMLCRSIQALHGHKHRDV